MQNKAYVSFVDIRFCFDWTRIQTSSSPSQLLLLLFHKAEWPQMTNKTSELWCSIYGLQSHFISWYSFERYNFRCRRLICCDYFVYYFFWILWSCSSVEIQQYTKHGFLWTPNQHSVHTSVVVLLAVSSSFCQFEQQQCKIYIISINTGEYVTMSMTMHECTARSLTKMKRCHFYFCSAYGKIVRCRALLRFSLIVSSTLIVVDAVVGRVTAQYFCFVADPSLYSIFDCCCYFDCLVLAM